MRIRREVVGALCALVVTGCAAVSASPDDESAATRSTTVTGVGVLPQPLATSATRASQETLPASSAEVSTSTTLPGTTTSSILGAEGNRILLIGDSILASTSKRYSNDTCKALVPLGWRVEVEAEVSRGVQFGNDVLAARMKAGWDAAVIFLGSNNSSGGNEYLKALNKIVTTLAPRPVVLVTASEFRPEMVGVNRTIRAMAEVYPGQVSILDWDAITKAHPEVLNTDGIHPTVEGRQVLAQAIADHVGPAPTGPGECLDSVYTDDSAGNVETGVTTPPSHGTPTSTVKPSGNPTTTVKPSGNPTTTVKPSGNPTTTVKPGSTTTLPGGVPTSSPPTIATVVVTPPTTAPQQPVVTQPAAQPPTRSTP